MTEKTIISKWFTVRTLEEFKQEKAMRFNHGKDKWTLVHFPSLLPLVKVLEFGAKKYSPDNWMKPMPRNDILDSMIRHLVALLRGEENDPESGLSHMGHIMANAMFYIFHYSK